MPSSWLATKQDELMLNGLIAGSDTLLSELPVKSGEQVAAELGGRMLLRYTWDSSETSREVETFVCPTPYSQEEVLHWLNWPNRLLQRPWVLLLDPKRIDAVQGPRWCSMGQGIEYVLPSGYDEEAIYGPPWVVEIR